MTLEERLYLVNEMKSRQEENLIQLQSYPNNSYSQHTQNLRSLGEPKKKTHFMKFFLVCVIAATVIFAAKIDLKKFDINDLPVYYNTFQEKVEELISKSQNLNFN